MVNKRIIWRLATYFELTLGRLKLYFRSKGLGENRDIAHHLPPLPPTKTIAHIWADFLRYLFDCARECIQDSEPNGVILRRNHNAVARRPRWRFTREWLALQPNTWSFNQVLVACYPPWKSCVRYTSLQFKCNWNSFAATKLVRMVPFPFTLITLSELGSQGSHMAVLGALCTIHETSSM